MTRNLTHETIAAINAAEFEVYYPASGLTTYLYFTDGKRIGYMQSDMFGGYSISTVHVPNRQTGTGFGMGEIDHMSTTTLSPAFAHAPAWASGDDRNSVRKYQDIAAFCKAHYTPLIRSN